MSEEQKKIGYKKAYVVQCCECKRIKKGKKWIVSEVKDKAPYTHSYCPRCLRKNLKKAVKHNRKRQKNVNKKTKR